MTEEPITIEDLIRKVLSYNPDADVEVLRRAYHFSSEAHSSQKRVGGSPYIGHPVAVASILADMKMDVATIAAGLLHDTIEDTVTTIKDIKGLFGEEIAFLVEALTKLSKMEFMTKEEAQAENFRKMLLVMAKDLRVILVKLADRLHNMETLFALAPEKRKINAIETLEIYAPLAERLGMGEVKGQLEDLAFPYVYPSQYKKLLRRSKPFYKEAEGHINKMKKVLLKKLLEENLNAEIHARKKHLFSLWKKLERSEVGWDFGKVHDIVAIRIIAGTVAQCYSALGIVHGNYKPVPYIGVSDFIAQPKPNGYRSIHTKVFGPEGRIVEVQIRTFLMHKEAEEGIAAHWVYSDAKGKGASDAILEKGDVFAPSEKLSWVRQLVDWQKEMTDSDEFLKAVKFDALRHRNFVFSPLGDVYDLPADSTPVDFAYAVHTDLGRFITGAKVDGKIVPLDYKLKSGQVVEILKSKNPRTPNPHWADFVVTTLARREINRYLRKTGPTE